MSRSWISLMEYVLKLKATQEFKYVAAGSWCEIVSEFKAIQEQNEQKPLDICYEVEAGLVNQNGATFITRKFLLPSKLPKHNLSAYRVELDERIQAYRIFHRCAGDSKPNTHHTPSPQVSLLPITSPTPPPQKLSVSASPPKPSTQESSISTSPPKPSTQESSISTSPPKPSTQESSISTSPPKPSMQESSISTSSLTLSASVSSVDTVLSSISPVSLVLKISSSDPNLNDDEVVDDKKTIDNVEEENSREFEGIFKLDSFDWADEVNETCPVPHAIVENRTRNQPCINKMEQGLNISNVDHVEHLSPGIISEEREEDQASNMGDVGKTCQLFTALDLDSVTTLPKSAYISEWLDLAAPYEQQQAAFLNGSEWLHQVEPREGDVQKNPTWSLEEATKAYENACASDTNKSILRHFIPEDSYSETLEAFKSYPPQQQTAEMWVFVAAVFDWEHMANASNQLRLLGLYEHKPLQRSESFSTWQEKTFPGDKKLVIEENLCDARAISTDDPCSESRELLPLHHLSFLGQMISEKSYTPPEVSLWFAVLSWRKPSFNPLSRQGVLVSQAAKLIDPFLYYGPEDFLDLIGTEQINAVTGLVQKMYLPVGAWVRDNYDEDEHIPRSTGNKDDYWDNRNLDFEQMQKPCVVLPDDHDMLFNSGDASYLLNQRVFKGKQFPGYVPSKLSLMETVDHIAAVEDNEAIYRYGSPCPSDTSSEGFQESFAVEQEWTTFITSCKEFIASDDTDSEISCANPVYALVQETEDPQADLSLPSESSSSSTSTPTLDSSPPPDSSQSMDSSLQIDSSPAIIGDLLSNTKETEVEPALQQTRAGTWEIAALAGFSFLLGIHYLMN